MPEYDAFGREVGEDTLGEWRTGPVPEPAIEAQRPAAHAPLPPPPPVRAPAPRAGGAPSRPRRRRPRVVSRLIILLVVLAVGGNLVGLAVSEIDDAVRDLPSTIGAPPPGAADPPAALEQGSLLRPAALRDALADLRGREIGRLQHLRLAPERIDAGLLTRRGTLVNVQLRHDGEFQRFSESGAGFGHLETIPYGRLDASAPRRLVNAVAERRPRARIDYLVPSYRDGVVTWGAYFKDGAIFLGDGRGRIQRRIS